MKMPFISFIVPVYNVEAYLRKCVDSIINQTYDDWELILIDDGSPDGCPQICDEYAKQDRRIRVIHQSNHGVAAARNAGLDTARGEWIWFIDSDDFIESEKTHLLINKVSGKEYDYIQFGHFRLNDDTGEKKEFKVSESHNLDKNAFFLKNLVYIHCSVWYKRNIIETHHLRFTKGLHMAEDLEFMYTYQLYTINPAQFGTALYNYRFRNNSAVHNTDTYRHGVEDSFCVLNNWFQRLQKENLKVEPWLDNKVLIFIKRLLYYAWHISDLDTRTFQRRLRLIMDNYADIGFSFPNDIRMRITSYSVRMYFLLNRLYLRLRGLD